MRTALRTLVLAACMAAGAGLIGCSSAPVPADYAQQRPVLDLRQYFKGPVTAHGLFTDRGQGRYTGQADDVVGQADGLAAGNALRWTYTLRLPVDGTTYDVQFEDWMYLMDEHTMLNKAVMSKFGVRLGEVTLSFHKP